ncbi:enhancer of split mgamma protein [Drosophila subpulchrella]|uniref:enhancer of split mgamma protein n=1 Tax=Drosophila subpulchrella TaxID=1486046 RepID=UPI0018A1782D|nr:enhancer of split mgamma protein [Drosophila subpulchrella]
MSSIKEQESTGPRTGAMSRTQQYRKVLKPLLERKRRARINRCVEDLKNLLKDLIHMDAEAMAKMEKADILELTVYHLHRQHRPAATPTTPSVCEPLTEQIATERYWSGFRHCALEVSRFLQRNNCQLNSKFVEEMEKLVPFEQLFWRPW